MQSFKLNLQHPTLKKSIFDWVDGKFTKLQHAENGQLPMKQLMDAVHDAIKDLIAIDVN